MKHAHAFLTQGALLEVLLRIEVRSAISQLKQNLTGAILNQGMQFCSPHSYQLGRKTGRNRRIVLMAAGTIAVRLCRIGGLVTLDLIGSGKVLRVQFVRVIGYRDGDSVQRCRGRWGAVFLRSGRCHTGELLDNLTQYMN